MEAADVPVKRRDHGIVLRVVGGILLAMGLSQGLGLLSLLIPAIKVLPLLWAPRPEGTRFLSLWLVQPPWSAVIAGLDASLLLFAGVQLLRMRRSGWIATLVVLGDACLTLGVYLGTGQIDKIMEARYPPEFARVMMAADSAAVVGVERFKRILLYFLTLHGVLMLYVASEWRRFFQPSSRSAHGWQAAKLSLALVVIAASTGWTFWGADYVDQRRVMRSAHSDVPAVSPVDFEKLPLEARGELSAILVRRLASEQTEAVAKAVNWSDVTRYLSDLTAEDVPKLLAASRSPNLEVRRTCCELLGAVATPEAQERLRELIEGPQDKVWSLAVRKLALLHPGRAPEALVAAAKKDDPDRNLYISSLGDFHEDRVLSLTLEFAGDPDPDIREAACSSLGHVPGPVAEQALILALQDAQPWVRGTACHTLHRIGTARAIPALIETLKAPVDQYKHPRATWTNSLHRDAESALANITGQDFGTDAQAWGKWWQETGSSFDLHKNLVSRLFTPLPPPGLVPSRTLYVRAVAGVSASLPAFQ